MNLSLEENKYQLRIKLVIFALTRGREFILRNYDKETIKIIDNQYFNCFSFGRVFSNMYGIVQKDKLVIIDDLENEISKLENSNDLFVFCKNEIPKYITELELELHDFIKRGNDIILEQQS